MIQRTAIVTTNRDEQPARAELNRITTGGIEAFGPSGPRLVSERGQPTRVLIVEDDQTMRNLVVNYLEEHDIEAVSAFGHDEVTRMLAGDASSLVILDLRLGQEDGLDLLREIRSRSDVPVIITTGHRRDEIDRVVGLELGADDYITKPFGLRELLARIRAVLRRREAAVAAVQRDPERGRCRFGGWQLDRRNRRLSDSSGTACRADQRRICAAAGVSRCSAATALPRASAAGDPHPRGCLRSQHRRAGAAPEAQAGDHVPTRRA